MDIHKFNHDPIKVTWPKPKVQTVNGIRHYQLPSGVWVPSVTTVLKASESEGIKKWRKKVGHAAADKISRHAAARGTSFHKINESYLKTGDPGIALSNAMPDQKMMFSRFVNVLNRIDNIRGIELPLYSERLKIAGTTDLVADFDGILSVIDFKQANRKKRPEWIENYIIQEAAYAAMLAERAKVLVFQLVTLVGVFEDHTPQIFVSPLKSVHAVKLKEAIKRYEVMISLSK